MDGLVASDGQHLPPGQGANCARHLLWVLASYRYYMSVEPRMSEYVLEFDASFKVPGQFLTV